MNNTTNFPGRHFAALLVFGAALVLVGCPGAAPTYLVDVTEDVVYGVGRTADSPAAITYSSKNLLLDVYSPVGLNSAAKPAIILVHGGSFSEGSKEQAEIVEYARFFAARGFVAFAIDYRLSGDNPPAPSEWNTIGLTAAAHAAMVDVKAAVRFVRANAETYDVDPERIALLGESAGAIASVPTAVSNQGDFAQDRDDLPVQPENSPGVNERVQTYIHFWGNADHVLLKVGHDDPPTMICHGTDDNRLGTRFETSERFAGVLDLWDVPYVFYEAEGMGHGAWEYRKRGRGLKLLTLDFLQEHLLGNKLLQAAEDLP